MVASVNWPPRLLDQSQKAVLHSYKQYSNALRNRVSSERGKNSPDLVVLQMAADCILHVQNRSRQEALASLEKLKRSRAKVRDLEVLMFVDDLGGFLASRLKPE